jgi:L-lactate dehydrogenase complex protein LldE
VSVRVALFVTCVNDTLFPVVGKATVTILERLGVHVEFPMAQTCCGQMHFNSGYRRECVPLVRSFATTFGGYDAVVSPSASCAAMVRLHHHTVDPTVRVPHVYELSEFLVDVLGVTDVGAYFPHSVTFHPTCHSQRLLRLGDRPERLLSAVEGLTLVPLAQPAECCGFGGTFSVKNPDVSTAMGRDKVGNVRLTGAEVLASADTSCLMHIGGVLSREDRLSGGPRGVAPIRVMHFAEILAETRSRLRGRGAWPR